MPVIKIGDKTMMKKGILYVVSAVLLGVALMLTPLYLLLTPSAFQTPVTSMPDYTSSTRGLQEAVARNELAYKVAPHYPSDEISVGLMSTLSLVLAFVVFRQFKKRNA